MRILRLYFVSLLAAPPVISDEDIEPIYVSLLAAPPVISGEDIAEVTYEAITLRLTLQFTNPNSRAALTLGVSPPAVSLGSLQNASSSNFTADITLHYNINYTLTITASNCAGSEMQHINFLRGAFHMLQWQSN